ncbi:MAG: hypothetical protein HGA33_06575 [Candidatus Moranbacteria bacterium]|nr:hypothetical protein [Candidatus Moranbacteria bacterium]
MNQLSESILSSVNQRKRLLLKRAVEIGVNVRVISERFSLFELSYDGKRCLFVEGRLPFNSRISTVLTKNKELTKLLLRENEVSVPAGFLATTLDEADDHLKRAGFTFPLVVKPLDAAKGMGVTVNIRSEDEFHDAIRKLDAIWDKNPKLRREFLVEETVYGNDYRILVLNGKVIACAQRIPAHVIGNGTDSVRSLIGKHNANRPESYQLKIDEDVLRHLKEQSISLDDIPSAEQRIELRGNANISGGGIAVDMTEKISAHFRKIAVDAAFALGVNYCGVDIYTEDISLENAPYHIIEINGAPDYDIHEKPVIQGNGIDVTEIIIRELFR